MNASSLRIVIVGLLLGIQPAIAAEKPFAGDDAAYVDWAWKNCELTGSPKQHELADKARAATGDAYLRAYEQQYRKIVEATPSPVEVKRMCQSIRDWYGPLGTRIAELIVSKAQASTAPGTPVGSRSSSRSSDSAGERRGGGGSGKRGGGF